jgi:pimeloyl-ACP methyl ester carboxylesterase
MAAIDPGKQVQLSIGESRIEAKYHQMGPADGEPIVFVHTGGAAVSGWMCWRLTLPFFAEAGYRCIAPDSVGFGGTRVTAGPNAGNPAFILALMDELGINQAHFAGNSGGAMSILNLATSHPERVLSYVASGGEPRGFTPEAAEHNYQGRSERLEFMREYLSADEPGLDGMKRSTGAFFFDPSHAEVSACAELRLASLRLPGMLAKERAHAADQLEGKRLQLVADDVFRRVQAPTYLLHGRDEPGFYSAEDGPALLDAAIRPVHLIPNCDATVLANCGHWPQLEMAERYNALVLAFLRGLRRD